MNTKRREERVWGWEENMGVNMSWKKSNMVTTIDQGMQERMTCQTSVYGTASPITKHASSRQ